MSSAATMRRARSGARARTTHVARSINHLSYLRRWLLLGTLIGIIAGCGAVVFYEALSGATHFLLGDLGGYHPPTPTGEGGATGSAGFSRPWAIPLVAGGGALLAGVLVARFAPEAEGHGTDAAIAAVHHNPRGIRVRAIVVKIVASAITIGSGGSGGREGPTGQISAGFGSLLSRLLDLSPSDARIAVSSGIGSGIGAIFGAPLGGAVLSAEVVYRDDVESAALVPAFVASIVAYAVFSGVEGFTPLFGYSHYRFSDPVQLVWFALIGIAGGLVGLLYAKGFYGLSAAFEHIPLPRGVRPAIGGLLVGAMGLIIPQVLGTGYGWIQRGLGSELLGLPLWIVLVLPFARILSTGLSIGSGGSGGIFGPGMVIGAFVGAAFWRLFQGVLPDVGHDPAPYAIVGMMCCFGSIARAPLAVMLMVAEMTGSLEILAPAMVAVGIASLIVSRNDDTIYRSQLKSRADSGAAKLVEGMPLLRTIEVRFAMASPRCTLGNDLGVAMAERHLADAGVGGAPLLDRDGRYIGIVEKATLSPAASDARLDDLVDQASPTVRPDVTLDVALDALGTTTPGWLPVLDEERRVIGTLAIGDVMRAYDATLDAAVRRAHGDSPDSSTTVRIEPGSPIEGRRVSEDPFPRGLLILRLRHQGQIAVPSGSIRIEAGDELTVIGSARQLEQLQRLARAPSLSPAGLQTQDAQDR